MAIGVCTVVLACNSCVIFANDVKSTENVSYSIGDDEIYEKTITYNASEGDLSYDDFDLPLNEETDGKLVKYVSTEYYVEDTLDPTTNKTIDSHLLSNDEVEELVSGRAPSGSSSSKWVREVDASGITY